MKKQGVGSALLEVMNRSTEAAETWPKALRKSVVVVVEKNSLKMVDNHLPPSEEEGGEPDVYRLLCQRAKAEPWYVVEPSPIHGDTLSSFVQLCLSFTPLQGS